MKAPERIFVWDTEASRLRVWRVRMRMERCTGRFGGQEFVAFNIEIAEEEGEAAE